MVRFFITEAKKKGSVLMLSSQYGTQCSLSLWSFFSLIMGCLLQVLSLLLLSASVSHATLQAQMYWHTVLPNTAMPSAIRDLLHPDVAIDEKTGTLVNVGKGDVYVNTKPGGTTVNVGHNSVGVNANHGNTHVGVASGGVNVNTGYNKPGGGTNVNVGKGGVNVGTGYHKPGGGTNVNVGHGGVNVHTGYKKPGGGTNVNVGHGGVTVGTGHKGKPVIVNVGYKSPFIYNYAATETQIHDDPRVTLFFMEKDLHSGAKMTLHFSGASNVATFLPRRAAENLPFSSETVPEILSKFSIEPSSAEAETMKKTIKECEEPAAAGEQKVCATSLESMVDISTSSLGTHDLVAASTTVGTGAKIEQVYTMAGVRKLAGSELVACHLESYAYAVFYCHKTQKTSAYNVEMVGENGAKVEAVAVCHADTAAWNPGHVAFKVLKVKPGTVPICHFLPQDHVVWAHSS